MYKFGLQLRVIGALTACFLQSATAAESAWKGAPPECRDALEQMSAELVWVAARRFEYAGQFRLEVYVSADVTGLTEKARPIVKMQFHDQPWVATGVETFASSPSAERVVVKPEQLDPADTFAKIYQRRVGQDYGFWQEEKRRITLGQGGAPVTVVTGEHLLEQNPLDGIAILSPHSFFDSWLTAPWSAARTRRISQRLGDKFRIDPVEIAKPSADNAAPSDVAPTDVVLTASMNHGSKHPEAVRDTIYWRLSKADGWRPRLITYTDDNGASLVRLHLSRWTALPAPEAPGGKVRLPLEIVFDYSVGEKKGAAPTKRGQVARLSIDPGSITFASPQEVPLTAPQMSGREARASAGDVEPGAFDRVTQNIRTRSAGSAFSFGSRALGAATGFVAALGLGLAVRMRAARQ